MSRQTLLHGEATDRADKDAAARKAHGQPRAAGRERTEKKDDIDFTP